MKVVVSRPWQLMDLGRPYEIRTATQVLGTLKANQEVEIEVPEDAELIYATVAHFSSNPFPVAQLEDNIRLQVKNSCDNWKLLVPLLPFYYLASKKHTYLKLQAL